MAMDYAAFGEEIQDLLEEMGERFTLLEPQKGAVTPTGKKTVTYKSHEGICVMGKYDSEFYSALNSVIHAGDVKFVCRFDEVDFEPVNDKDETISYGSKKYKVINVENVLPDGQNVIIYIIQGRRVN